MIDIKIKLGAWRKAGTRERFGGENNEFLLASVC